MIYHVIFGVALLLLFIYYCFKQRVPIRTIISVEGNIGAGKTSLMNLLKTKFHNVEFIFEPVDEWNSIQDNKGNNLLQLFYNDKSRWSYTFQNIAYITRMTLIINIVKKSNKKNIFLDRSLSADLNTFSKMLHDDGFINDIEWNAYNKWNKFYETYFGNTIKHKIIYLRCEPDIAYQRMQMRNRDSEKDIPYEYLKSLHKYHDEWLLNNNNNNDVLVIDVNKNFMKNKTVFNNIYNDISNFIAEKLPEI